MRLIFVPQISHACTCTIKMWLQLREIIISPIQRTCACIQLEIFSDGYTCPKFIPCEIYNQNIISERKKANYGMSKDIGLVSSIVMNLSQFYCCVYLKHCGILSPDFTISTCISPLIQKIFMYLFTLFFCYCICNSSVYVHACGQKSGWVKI